RRRPRRRGRLPPLLHHAQLRRDPPNPSAGPARPHPPRGARAATARRPSISPPHHTVAWRCAEDRRATIHSDARASSWPTPRGGDRGPEPAASLLGTMTEAPLGGAFPHQHRDPRGLHERIEAQIRERIEEALEMAGLKLLVDLRARH